MEMVLFSPFLAPPIDFSTVAGFSSLAGAAPVFLPDVAEWSQLTVRVC